MNDELQHDRSHRTAHLQRDDGSLMPVTMPGERRLNDAEKLTDYMRIVKWTLWCIATHKGIDQDEREPTPEEEIAARNAQALFTDAAWTANVTAQFAINHSAHSSTDQDIDYLAFLGLAKAQEGDDG